MPPDRAAPRTAWLLAGLLSLIMTGLVLVAFLYGGAARGLTWILPCILAAIAAFGFAFTWPRGGLRWGVVTSGGFWCFFLLVFLSYLSLGRFEPMTLLRAASVMLAGVVGAWAARALKTAPGELAAENMTRSN